MTQTTNHLTTINDLYTAIGPIDANRTAFRLVNKILAANTNRPTRVAGQRYTTAAAVERAAKADARLYDTIIKFMATVRTATTETRVRAAITTLRNRTRILTEDTTPEDLATALRAA
jgi:hypothetical protein